MLKASPRPAGEIEDLPDFLGIAIFLAGEDSLPLRARF
jgi:hypothetical protein